MRTLTRIAAISLLAVSAFGQGQVSLDYSQAQYVKPWPELTYFPGTCKLGSFLTRTDQAYGSNLYICAANNTWTAISSGAGGSTVWSALTAPIANLTIPMSAYTSTFTGTGAFTFPQILMPQRTTGLSNAYAFAGYPATGMDMSSGQLQFSADSAIAVFTGPTTGALSSTMQLHVVPQTAGGDGVFKVCTAFTGPVTHCWRMLAQNSTDSMVFSDVAGTTRIQVPNAGGPVFPNTGISGTGSPIEVQQSTLPANKTWIYETGAGLRIAPQVASQNLDFWQTKYQNGALRVMTNDGEGFLGTGMLQMNAADSAGYTSIEADNDTGFRLRVFNHSQGVAYGQLLANATNWTLTGANLAAPAIQYVTVSTVATLPTCNAGAKGLRSQVSDATAPTYLGTLTGGGAVFTPVACNGTAWISY